MALLFAILQFHKDVVDDVALRGHKTLKASASGCIHGPKLPLLFRYQICGAYVFLKLLAPDEHAPDIVDALGLDGVVGRTVWLG